MTQRQESNKPTAPGFRLKTKAKWEVNPLAKLENHNKHHPSAERLVQHSQNPNISSFPSKRLS